MGTYQQLAWFLASGLLLIGLLGADLWLLKVLRLRQQEVRSQSAVVAIQNPVQPEDETPSVIIAQSLVLFTPSGFRLSPKEKELLAKKQAGGVLLLAKNIADTLQTELLVNEILATATVSGSKPLVAVDQEGGAVSRLPWVEHTPQGEIATEVEALSVARARGEELRQLGIRLNLTPVVEKISSDQSYLARTQRAFVSDSGTLAAAMVRGLSQAGIIPVAKHFPGGLGRVGEDPHQTLPKLTVSKQQLEEDLAPFRAVIAAQVPAIMVTHILYPEIDEMPASASQIFMTDLLRNQLGFTGLVVVDDLSMKAVTGTYEVGEYAVKSVNAGADLLLVSDFIDYETIRSALIAATERGELKRDRLLEAQVRVEQFRH